jgi:hypothetical protein
MLEAGPRRQGDCRGSNLAGAVGLSTLAVIGWGLLEAVSRRRARLGAPSSGAAAGKGVVA